MTRASIADRAALAARQVLGLVAVTSAIACILGAVVVADRHARVLRLEGQKELHAAASLVAWLADVPETAEAQFPVGALLAERSEQAAQSATEVYRYIDIKLTSAISSPANGTVVATRR